MDLVFGFDVHACPQTDSRPDGESMKTTRRLRSTVGNVVPTEIRDLGRRGYNRWRQFRADRAFQRRSHPEPSADIESDDHVVLVVVDALRADAIDYETTPFLASLDGTTAVAPAPWTYPSVASLMTGRYPHEHGAIRQNDDPERGGDDIVLPPDLPEDEMTLAEYLAGAGFDTFGGFGFTMPFLALEGRFATHKLYHQAPAEHVLASYGRWINGRSADRTFAYLHLFDLHGPFDTTPPDQYWETHDVDEDITGTQSWRYTDQWHGSEVERYIEHRKRLYRAALDYVDDQLAAFAERLDDRYEDATLIVTGDHGDAFWEMAEFDSDHFTDPRPAYGVGHGGTPFEAIARVPLLSDDFEFNSGPSSLIDVSPTMIEHLGLDVTGAMSGRSHTEELSDDRILLTESARFGYEKKAIYLDGWKLLVSRGDKQEVGFTLPEETPCDIPKDVEIALHDALPPWPSGTEDRIVSDRVKRRLENLGYT